MWNDERRLGEGVDLEIEEGLERPMDTDTVATVLRLLICWALRAARQSESSGRGDSMTVVTVDSSKGSGDENSDK